MNQPILGIHPLGFPWRTQDPFLFCVYHKDDYPKGNDELGPAASLAGRYLGQDFVIKDGWRMYHGHKVPGFPSHPHRGFEPITLLFKGEQLHRDSLGNEMLVKAGDVQWTTAGRGIIHAEGPSKSFVERGGDLEGIQLWLNLPAKDKMMPAAYQHLKSEDIPIVKNNDGSMTLKVIAGTQGEANGLIQTQTDVNVFTVHASESGQMTVTLPKQHQSLVYLLDGEVLVNNKEQLKKGALQMFTFNTDGEAIELKAAVESTLLILSGEPIEEEVTQYGPYVMNTQTEIMEAMRDFQQGKMGYLY